MLPKMPSSLKFYIVVVVVAALLFGLQELVSTRPFAEAKIDKLDPLQEKQFDLFRELNSLLITLATAAIGAVGAFVLDRDKAGQEPLALTQKIRALSSVVLAGISIYCGYISHEMVSSPLVPKDNR